MWSPSALPGVVFGKLDKEQYRDEKVKKEQPKMRRQSYISTSRTEVTWSKTSA